MLDQFRNDEPTNSNAKDPLGDGFSSGSMNRKKMIYTSSGGALLLVVFLFVLGFFRTDEDTKPHFMKESKPLVAKQEEPLLMQELLERVEKLELKIEALKKPTLTDNALKKMIADMPSKDETAYSIGKPSIEPSDKEEINPLPTPRPTPKSKTYTIQRGDTLSKISKQFYGSTKYWEKLYNANAERIGNMNALKVGTEILIPDEKDL